MLADFYGRAAVAAAQALSGFDEDWFRDQLDSTPAGISVGPNASSESKAAADLIVRLAARLYPKLAIRGDDSTVESLTSLAREINPRIEIITDAALGIVIADGAEFPTNIYAGSDGWDALLSAEEKQTSGASANPFGAGLAACLSAAELFRSVFLPTENPLTATSVRISALLGDVAETPTPAAPTAWRLGGESLLVGAGAVGQGALWALSRAPLDGVVHVVDMETVELSNLQRYALSSREDVDRSKVDIASGLPSRVKLIPHDEDLATFLSSHGYVWDALLLAVDSERDRVGAQGALPRFIANAWTQPGDLGVSSHSTFGGDGACVACLYLPTSPQRNEDELIAEALRVPHLLMQIRTLLATGQPVDRDLLGQVAQALDQPLETVLEFEGRSVRELYIQGFCGGAVIPLNDAGRLNRAGEGAHVPLAHQSALAGILLAAALVRRATRGAPVVTEVTRFDVLRPIATSSGLLLQPLRASRDGRCICDDPDFVSAYGAKYGLGLESASQTTSADRPPSLDS